MDEAESGSFIAKIATTVPELIPDISKRFYLFVAGHFVLYYWMHRVVAPARPGWPRVMRALFLAPVLAVMGVLFDSRKNEEFTAATYSIGGFYFLIPFQIFSFCMNRGQVVKAYDCKSTLAFTVSLLLPTSIAFDEKKVSNETEEKPTEPHAYKDARFSVLRYEKTERWKQVGVMLVQTIVKLLLMDTLRYGAQRFDESGHDFLRNMCFGWYGYAIGSGIEDFMSLIMLLTANVKLKHNFDSPWLSQSLRELWSRRYNLVVSEALRQFAYEPIHEGCWVRGSLYFEKRKPSVLRKSMALLASFTASCILHIGLLLFAHPFRVCFSYGLFFVANGFVILLEDFAKSFVSRQKGWSALLKGIPKWCWQIYTISTLSLLGHFLFCPDFVKFGYDDAILNGGPGLLPRQ